MRAQSVAFHTLGCKVNQYDTKAMRERFEQAGYRTVDFDRAADVYVVNTCTVTGTGDKKSLQAIRRCHRQNPDAAIVVCGCLAQRAAQEVALPGVRLVLGTQRRDQNTGDLLDVFIYSIVFERSGFAGGYQQRDPYDFCGKQRSRFIVLASGLMKEIKPYGAEDI